MEKTILIVDDDPGVNATLKMLLAERNYSPVIATSVAGAVEAGLSVGPDLILLDLRLPDGNGLSALRTLRELKPTGTLRQPKVIVISGTADAEAVHEAKRLQVDYVVAKPFEMRDLLRRIELVLARLNVSDVRHLLLEGEAVPIKRPKLPELGPYSESDWSYQQKEAYGDHFMIVTRRSVSLESLTAGDESDLKKSVLIFRETAGAWRAAWPTPAK